MSYKCHLRYEWYYKRGKEMAINKWLAKHLDINENMYESREQPYDGTQ